MSQVDFLNSSQLRTALSRISLFIATFESFSDFIERNVTILHYPKEKIREIFEYYKDGNQKNLTYSNEVFSFKKALLWFVDMSAITSQECDTALKIRDLRNELVHEMSTYVYRGIPKELNSRYVQLIQLYQKINDWWIENIEASINPDLQSDITPKEVHNLEIVFLNLLGEITLEDKCR